MISTFSPQRTCRTRSSLITIDVPKKKTNTEDVYPEISREAKRTKNKPIQTRINHKGA